MSISTSTNRGTVMAISTTKAITGTTALPLVEEGELDLDAPAKEYAPALGEIQVLDGFDGSGDPILRAPKSDITTKQLGCTPGLRDGHLPGDQRLSSSGTAAGQQLLTSCWPDVTSPFTESNRRPSHYE